MGTPFTSSRRSRRIVSGVACLLWTANGWGTKATAGQPVRDRFARCEPTRGASWSYDNLLCLRHVGLEQRALEDVRRRIRALVAADGNDGTQPWATLVLAHVALDQQQRPEAIALYERAAEGFAQSHEAEGEVVARQNLANQLRQRGDVATAARHVALAVAAAEASGQPLTIARAAVTEVAHSMATGGDIGRVHRVLVRADRVVPRTAPTNLRRTILFHLANANLYLGRAEEAVEVLDRHRALASEDQSTTNAAVVEFNWLVAKTMLAERRPNAALRRRMVEDAESVVSEAQRMNDPRVEAQTHKVLGDLLATSDAERSAAHLGRCLELEKTLGVPGLRMSCLRSLAQLESARDPGRAERLSQEALSLLRPDRNTRQLAFAWQARLRLVWRTLPLDSAVEQSLVALDAIERLRASQAGESGRAALFGNWTSDYQWLTGQLLQTSSSRLAQAFEVGERLRARVLIEQLEQKGGPAARDVAGAAADQNIHDVARRIASAQRRLLAAPPSGPERRTLLDELRLLELEREDASSGRVRVLSSSAIPFASLREVQQALDEREAMIWFSLAPWVDLYGNFGGGSWALVVTRETASAHRLEETADVDDQGAALTGLLRDRSTTSDTWMTAARRVGQTLFGEAGARLPPSITRLVVVSDGAVHRLPIEALPLGTGPTLDERFEVSVAPSATVWLRLRASNTNGPRGRALVVADPDLAGGSPDGDRQLTMLPGARREARTIARLLDVEPQYVVEGAAATERFVKSTPLVQFSVVHLAVHARADQAFPERSAVFLAPGDDREDGWLQPDEIAALDFGGRLVVLSACDSAEGSVVSGEGPLSLARAFFAGGARAVVATRWPLRDDDAQALMERFYRALRAGQSAAAALRRARAESRDAGLPPAAWAGVVLLGDGQLHPLPPRPDDDSFSVWVGLAAIAIAITIGGAAWLRRRHADRSVPGL